MHTVSVEWQKQVNPSGGLGRQQVRQVLVHAVRIPRWYQFGTAKPQETLAGQRGELVQVEVGQID
jgi:hypothetical protein